MGLQFNKSNAEPAEQTPATTAVAEKEEIEVLEKFDITDERQKMNEVLVNSQEVDDIVSTICVDEPNTIVEFGSEVAEEIAKCSDQILNSVNMKQVNDSGQMLTNLSKIMDKFDLDDFAKTKEPGFFQKLFKKANSAIETMFQKYETLGGEVEKIQIELQNYEREIGESNKQLGAMLNENFNYYNELEKYIVAGEMGVEELDNELLPQFKAKAETGDQIDMANYQELLNIKDMLVQRIYDLKVAENISLQTIPMLRTMQHNNYGLIRKINSAFVVTLPVFKQCFIYIKCCRGANISLIQGKKLQLSSYGSDAR